MMKLRTQGSVFTIWASFLCRILLVAAQETDPVEVRALLSVKKNLKDPDGNLQNWKVGENPCTSNWRGVSCANDSDDGHMHVKELQLFKLNLSGSLSPELGKLKRLEILDFMWNNISGSIPEEIGNIIPLKLLLLNGNRLSGSLPDALGNLVNLTRLQVDENDLSGPIPRSYGNLKNMKHIHFNNNSLSGQIPRELSNMTSLLHLLLDTNNLSGNLPQELSNLPYLRILQLDNNNFDGSEIPESYGSLFNMTKLSLRNCSLAGNIPDLSGIKHLSYIDLSMNRLSGPIPSKKLSDNITTIILSDNSLSGPIPSSFSSLHKLQKLSLENNKLNGSVPGSLWNNISFDSNNTLTLDLENNSLSTIEGDLNPPQNVILKLEDNPVCSNANLTNIHQFCKSRHQIDEQNQIQNHNSSSTCHKDDNYEFVNNSQTSYCASPLTIGYRLKSPSFSYFLPYKNLFEEYLSNELQIMPYQVSVDSFSWESRGRRLRMYLKVFPLKDSHHTIFNVTEVIRMREKFASWSFTPTDFFGPYELLNFSQPNSTSVPKVIGMGTLAGIIVGAVACTVAISALISFFIIRKITRDLKSSLSKKYGPRINMNIDGVKSFTFQEMELATNNFHNSTKVGRGGYGSVYKGALSDQTLVAIKRAAEGSLQGQREFLTEIELLSRLHHRNLVSLLGYCDEEGEQMLVYEFMSNGTLHDWLSGRANYYLNFSARLKIALGASKGLLYLHTEANPPVFHRDVKASNILLDSKFIAKVADFGLSKLAPVLDEEGSVPGHVSTVVKGTPGYLDPEYFLTHKLSDKSDVYSLGVVFLELVTGRQPISHGKNIVREANMAKGSGNLSSIIDPKMGTYPKDCIEKFTLLSLKCSDDNPDKRPSMLDVVRELEAIIKMMPETDGLFSETSSMHFAPSFAESSSYNESHIFSNVSGSDFNSEIISKVIAR
ncbi:hypothetical protein SAY86_000750 [Trapa natans]|uniref:non-specific serine/threonine protein kinase n=1 Tax=Trapa natans TaxID=22666 RepID=A0AAN7RFX0_TRANT|nr:hypothetical protein SAY86_000750 [Trapa natans]